MLLPDTKWLSNPGSDKYLSLPGFYSHSFGAQATKTMAAPVLHMRTAPPTYHMGPPAAHTIVEYTAVSSYQNASGRKTHARVLVCGAEAVRGGQSSARPAAHPQPAPAPASRPRASTSARRIINCLNGATRCSVRERRCERMCTCRKTVPPAGLFERRALLLQVPIGKLRRRRQHATCRNALNEE